MYSMEEAWKEDFVSDLHRERRAMTKNSITHHIKKELKRRISSSWPEDVFMTDCCWMCLSNTQLFIVCALNNACVCLLNALNLSQVNLFGEWDKNGESNAKVHHHSNQKGSLSKPGRRGLMQFIAVDCVLQETSPTLQPPLPRSASTATTKEQKFILCMILDGWVQVCYVDPIASMAETRRLPKCSPSRIFELLDDNQERVLARQVRFSPSSARIFALQTHGLDQAEYGRTVVSFVAVLKRESPSLDLRFLVELPWSKVSPPVGSNGRTDLIRFWGWWDEHSFLCVWSSGWLQLLRAKDLCVISEGSLSEDLPRDAVLLATAAPSPAAFFPMEGEHPCGTEEGLFFLAVAFECNVVATFKVYIRKKVGWEGSQCAVEKNHHGLCEDAKHTKTFVITPTQSTYYTEDIPVSSLALFHVHSWVLCISLESGAILFVDAETMDLLVHRLLKRQSEFVGPLAWVDRSYVTNHPSFSCLPLSKPLGFVACDHNTVTILRP